MFSFAGISRRMLIVMTTAACLACGPYKGPYLEIDHPYTFIGCPSEDIENPQDHAFEAMVFSLADEDWVIEQSSSTSHKLSARRCVPDPAGTGDYLKRDIKYCLVLAFIFLNNGDVRAINPADKRFQHNMLSRAVKWVTSLDRVYSELRCYSKDELSRRHAGREPGEVKVER